jgi:hypothetical protein
MNHAPLNPPSDGGQPFFTRRSVIAWAAVSVITLLGYGGLSHSQGIGGLVGAVAISASVVSFIVAWIGGAVLALRLGSIFALLVAFLFPPFGSVLVAILTPPPRSGPPGLRR